LHCKCPLPLRYLLQKKIPIIKVSRNECHEVIFAKREEKNYAGENKNPKPDHASIFVFATPFIKIQKKIELPRPQRNANALVDIKCHPRKTRTEKWSPKCSHTPLKIKIKRHAAVVKPFGI
jgi:hypothetical protein